MPVIREFWPKNMMIRDFCSKKLTNSGMAHLNGLRIR